MATDSKSGSEITIPLISLSSHGGTRVLVECANALADRGAHVRFLIPKGRQNTVYELRPTVVVNEVNIRTGIKYFDYLIYLLVLPFYLTRGTAVANFFVTYFPVRIAAIFHGIGYVYLVQDIESKYRGLWGPILNGLCELTYRWGRHIVVTNEFLNQELARRSVRASLTLRIGPNAVFFEMAAQHSMASAKFDVIYFLRHEPWKRRDRFDEIASWLHDNSKTPLRILCVSQSEDLFFLYRGRGFCCAKPRNDRELVALYDSSRVLLLTSAYEGFGLPPLEAMARGVPVVAFEAGGPALYIENGVNSYLVADSASAGERIMRLLSDAREYEQISHAAKRSAANYKMANAVNKFVDYLLEECAPPQRNRSLS